jgi:hypothetical protein
VTRPILAAWACLLLAGAGQPATAQERDSLDAAVERARLAWLAHDVRALVASSDTMRLRVPGVAVNHSMRPGQAARLLEQYLEASEEQGLELREIRPVGEGHAYAELERRFAVRGTDDRRAETVFFGFRQVEGRWRLREVRIAP